VLSYIAIMCFLELKEKSLDKPESEHERKIALLKCHQRNWKR
jgi:hypothetical protein